MSRLSRYLSPPVPTSTETAPARRYRDQAPSTIGVGLDAVAAFIRQTTHGRLQGTEFASFESFMTRNPISFAAWTERMALVKQARFQFQRMDRGRPGGLYGHADLRILETPWPGGTTSSLLKLIETDVTRAGLCAIRRGRDQLDVLDPHKIFAIREMVSDRPGATPFLDRLVAYSYIPSIGADPIVFHPDERELAIVCPIPDPAKNGGGLSWLAPAVLDLRGDDMLTRHRLSYFEKAASPNLVIKSAKPLSDPQYERLQKMIRENHEGADNAYRTLILEGAADVDTVGSNMAEARFVDVQDAVENRISVASRVPAPILGVKIGASPTYNNLSTARRQFVDQFARPQWADIADALSVIVPPPEGSRLWYADAHISALQQDASDAAEIRAADASTVRTLVDGGFTPESAVLAVRSNDFSLLEHSGLISVQLQPIGSTGSGKDPE